MEGSIVFLGGVQDWIGKGLRAYAFLAELGSALFPYWAPLPVPRCTPTFIVISRGKLLPLGAMYTEYKAKRVLHMHWDSVAANSRRENYVLHSGQLLRGALGQVYRTEGRLHRTLPLLLILLPLPSRRPLFFFLISRSSYIYCSWRSLTYFSSVYINSHTQRN